MVRKRNLIALPLIGAALAIGACRQQTLETAISTECHGPFGKTGQILGGRSLSNQAYEGVEVRIVCSNGKTHIARVK